MTSSATGALRRVLGALLFKSRRSETREMPEREPTLPKIASAATGTDHSLSPKARFASLYAAAKEHVAQSRMDVALSTVEPALEIDPTSQGALRLKMTALSSLGRTVEARDTVARLLELHPLDTAAYRMAKSLGMALPDRSLDIARKFINASKSPQRYMQAVLYLYDAAMFDEAEAIILEGLAFSEHYAAGRTGAAAEKVRRTVEELRYNLGMVYEAQTHFEEAIAIYDELSTSSFAQKAALSRVRCLHAMGRFEEALNGLRAVQVNPMRRPFSVLHLEVLQGAGSLQEAYLYYRKRPISQQIAEFFNQPEPFTALRFVEGAGASKRALILAEGGPGDELRMAAVYGDIRHLYPRLTISCDPRLTSILERSFPAIRFIPTKRHRREFVGDTSDRELVKSEQLKTAISDELARIGQESDLVCSVLDVLGELRPNRESFREGRQLAWLHPDPLRVEHWAKATKSPRLKVGLAWRSMLQSTARNRHYFTVEQLRAFGSVNDCEFWVLQPQATEEELRALSTFLDVKVSEGLDLVNDFEGQSALIANLDAVVSPFTTTGELSGSMGVRTLLLAATHQTTWRRNDDGTDLWHGRTEIVAADLVHAKERIISLAAARLQELKPSRRFSR